jgi:hypothetical protein
MQDKISNAQLATIETSQLADVTGGGLLGGALKLARKAAPYVERAVPFIKDKAVGTAKWTGIPFGLGGGIAWAKHQFSH